MIKLFSILVVAFPESKNRRIPLKRKKEKFLGKNVIFRLKKKKNYKEWLLK